MYLSYLFIFPQLLFHMMHTAQHSISLFHTAELDIQCYLIYTLLVSKNPSHHLLSISSISYYILWYSVLIILYITCFFSNSPKHLHRIRSILYLFFSVTPLSNYIASDPFCNDSTLMSAGVSLVQCATKCTEVGPRCKGFEYLVRASKECQLKRKICTQRKKDNFHVAYQKIIANQKENAN